MQQVYNLLNEDLQYSVDYWLGYIYFNTGNYLNTFKVWRKYIENSDKAFDSSLKKIEKIRDFLKQYEILINSINDLKKNLQFVKRYIIGDSYKIRKESSNFLSSGTSDGKEISLSDIKNRNKRQINLSDHNQMNLIYNKCNIVNHGNSPNNKKLQFKGCTNDSNNKKKNNNFRLNFYFDTLKSIKNIEPNLKQNKCIIYEFYKACSIFYVESKLHLKIFIL